MSYYTFLNATWLLQHWQKHNSKAFFQAETYYFSTHTKIFQSHVFNFCIEKTKFFLHHGTFCFLAKKQEKLVRLTKKASFFVKKNKFWNKPCLRLFRTKTILSKTKIRYISKQLFVFRLPVLLKLSSYAVWNVSFSAENNYRVKLF